eukprot:TRINITY_DN3289_c0_g1_i10.p1 TRINITY_DN3289_c0_g1~~TRINITY_DN3289_c0_g1_i10.p1  ORF type:complete len:150 (+),score=5.27 TRINITY_DN3289_c0_g1_i10:238-687(+)
MHPNHGFLLRISAFFLSTCLTYRLALQVAQLQCLDQQSSPCHPMATLQHGTGGLAQIFCHLHNTRQQTELLSHWYTMIFLVLRFHGICSTNASRSFRVAACCCVAMCRPGTDWIQSLCHGADTATVFSLGDSCMLPPGQAFSIPQALFV